MAFYRIPCSDLTWSHDSLYSIVYKPLWTWGKCKQHLTLVPPSTCAPLSVCRRVLLLTCPCAAAQTDSVCRILSWIWVIDGYIDGENPFPSNQKAAVTRLRPNIAIALREEQRTLPRGRDCDRFTNHTHRARLKLKHRSPAEANTS